MNQATAKVLNADGKILGPRGGDAMNPNYSPEHRSGLKVEPLPSGGLGLHRKDGYQPTAVRALKNEQPWHRMAGYMLLAGRTNSEIAMSAGVAPETVSVLRSQQWFQELLATLGNREGEEVLGVIKAEALNSVEKLVALRDYAEKESVQLAAAVTLLEHAKGKAIQQTISMNVPPNFANDQEEYENIQNELRVLRARNSIPVDSRAADEGVHPGPLADEGDEPKKQDDADSPTAPIPAMPSGSPEGQWSGGAARGHGEAMWSGTGHRSGEASGEEAGEAETIPAMVNGAEGHDGTKLSV